MSDGQEFVLLLIAGIIAASVIIVWLEGRASKDIDEDIRREVRS